MNRKSNLFSMAMLAVLAGLSAATTAHAQNDQAAEAPPIFNVNWHPEPFVPPPEPPIADGTASKSWLMAQGARQQASKTRQTLSGPVMGKVYERYVKSFTIPIPAHIGDRTSASR